MMLPQAASRAIRLKLAGIAATAAVPIRTNPGRVATASSSLESRRLRHTAGHRGRGRSGPASSSLESRRLRQISSSTSHQSHASASSSLESRRLRLAPPFDRPASGFLHWNRVPALYCPSLIITMRAVSRIFQRFSRLHTASAAEALVEHCRARAPRVVKPQSLAISENMLAQWRRTSGRWP